MTRELDRRTFLAGTAAVASSMGLARGDVAAAAESESQPATGPMIGHTTATTTRIWFRPASDHHGIRRWTCTVMAKGVVAATAPATLTSGNDFSLLFDVVGLRARTAYTVSIRPAGSKTDIEPATASFTTSPADGRRAKVTLGLGSCAPDGPNVIWDRIVDEGGDSFVMLGDTPYIDSTDLAVARTKHRAFLNVPELATMISSMPIWATWDDHDFGGNDTAGDLQGKRHNRTAFVDYRANATFGHDRDGTQLSERTSRGEGVYTSFRRGPVEVFLLDPRWFSRTERSWADKDELTCLGAVQWQWLKRQLRRSTATFKLVATGMIWDDKQNTESDDWATYDYEREAIFTFIAEEKIKGVVLIGGDIHVSRALNYGPRVGYDLWQYVTSPMHDRTIPSLNVPNPHLVHSAVEPWTFLKVEADTTVEPATLDATWINRDGKVIFAVKRTADDLGYRR